MTPSHRHTHRFVITILATFIIGTQAIDTRACYWPNGNRAPNYLIPCDSNNSTTTHCCWAGELCLSNGLCMGPVVGVPYRGACTDRDWNDKKCPPVCQQVNTDGSLNLWKCQPPTDQSKWDCGKNTSAICKDPSQTFAWPGGSVYKIAGDVPRTSTVDRNGNALTAVSTGSSASTSATANSQTPSSGSDNNRSVTLGVGLGLGIPLALALVLLGMWTVRERKLRKEAMARNADASVSLMRQSEFSADKYGGPQPYVAAAYESSPGEHQPHQTISQQEVYEMPNERPTSEMQSPPMEPVKEA